VGATRSNDSRDCEYQRDQVLHRHHQPPEMSLLWLSSEAFHNRAGARSFRAACVGYGDPASKREGPQPFGRWARRPSGHLEKTAVLAQTTREIIERGRGQYGHSTSSHLSQGAMWEPQLNRPLRKIKPKTRPARLQNVAGVHRQKKGRQAIQTCCAPR